MADYGCDRRLFNVIFLGLSFMFLFTAFQTCSMVEQTVISGAKEEANSTFTGDGYTSLAIIYAVFAASNWAAPSIIAVIGSKWAMVLGGALYCLFIASFLKPMTWALYTGSVLVGFGAAVIWTGQGSFLTDNSDSHTIGRNSGIFWALLQCSLLFGNLYTYFAFSGEEVITSRTRTILFIVLTSVGVLGLLLLFVLRPLSQQIVYPEREALLNSSQSSSSDDSPPGALEALKKSFKLLCTKEMILLSLSFAYTGFELSFFSGVFGTCVGNTMFFGSEAKSLLGLVGMFIGVGEILGGSLFGLMGKRTNVYGRDPIVVVGYLAHMVTFFLIFLSLPASSPLRGSYSVTYITPNKYIVLLCAFLLGYGDSSFNTQIYSILGGMYPNQSAPAFALYKFIQSVASAGAFVYSQHLLLHWQLLIMVVFGTIGMYSFSIVEWAARNKYMSRYSEIGSDS